MKRKKIRQSSLNHRRRYFDLGIGCGRASFRGFGGGGVDTRCRGLVHQPDNSQNIDKTDLSFTFALEGGQAKTFILHHSMKIPEKAADLIRQFIAKKNVSDQRFRLSAAMAKLKAAGIDLLGNPLGSVYPKDGWKEYFDLWGRYSCR